MIFSKRIIIFCFFLLGGLQSYSINYLQKNDQFNEIKQISDGFKQYRYFQREIFVPSTKVNNIEKWISYFENKKNEYANDNQVVYVNLILVQLYRLNLKFDKAIDLGMSTYYSHFYIKEKNKLLCELLGTMEWCFHKKENNLELIRINKEKLKVCDKRAVDYHSGYYNMGLYDLALKSYKNSIGFNKPSYKNYNLYEQGYHHNNIGVYYMYDNKIDSALYFYKKSILIFEKQKSIDSIFKQKDVNFLLNIVAGNIGTCLLKKGEYRKAIPLYLKELNGSNIYYKGRNWLGSEKLFNRLAFCYIKTNQYKKATHFINKIKNYKNLFYKLKSEYYNQLNNKDSTIFFKNKYITTSDSIFNQKLKQKEIESLHALDFNDKIKEQEEHIEKLKKKDNTQTNQIKFITFLTVVLILIFIFLLYFYFDKLKKKKIVEIQKNEIETALNNNKILLKELNHRVKNNLQMISSVISLQASKIVDQNSKTHFNSAIKRVKVLSKIHNSLYSKNEQIELDILNYVTILKDYLVKSIINPEIKVKFIIDILPDLYFNNDTKTTIGLIINELVTNSLKYAFTDEENNIITISIYNKNEYYYFLYTDNGQGFEYDKVDKSKSIGLNLISRLVNQLGDEAEISSSHGMEISFNLPEKK